MAVSDPHTRSSASRQPVGTGLWAHTANKSGCPHLLRDHLKGTAALAASFGAAFGCAGLAGRVALVHDLGKAGGCFQEYLRTCQQEGDAVARGRFPSRDHKSAGARLLWERTTAGLIGALAVYGHHGGLPSVADLREKMRAVDPAEVTKLEQAVLGDALSAWPDGLPDWAGTLTVDNALDVEMLGRFAQSVLADADFLDTARHFGRPYVEGRSTSGLAERAEAGYRRLAGNRPESALARARRDAHEEVLSHNDEAPGWYVLAGATGMGKTVTGLMWALQHARRHGLRRVVTAVPYITVTSQTAQAYRALLDVRCDDLVLEHHSRVEFPGQWGKLAAENWDAPIVVTTTVRLFESLFARRPSAVRRLHRLARCVVVLDEPQTLPIRLLDTLYDGLRCLVERFGASVVLMSATPPALDRIATLAACRPTALLADPHRWPVFRQRVRWAPVERADHARVATLVDQEASVLCVLNTARDATEVARRCQTPVIYLSRLLRPADVDERIAQIRRLLGTGSPCRVVATQLVEAGVDLDFPVVIRALGPAPSLEQAAGRCNREGQLASGTVRVIDLVDGGLPLDAAYRPGTSITQALLGEGAAELGEPGLSRAWFERVLSDPAVATDRGGIQDMRVAFNYPEVDRRVRLVDDDGVAVVVPWPASDPRAGDLQADIAAASGGYLIDPRAARRLQDVTVNVRPWMAARARRCGMLPAEPSVLDVWSGPYDPLVGIDPAGFDASPAMEVVW